MTLQVQNSIDMHCHFSPDSMGTLMAEHGLDNSTGTPAHVSVREAIENGQAGLVLKPHGFASPAVAATLSALNPDFHVFGGICLDHISGGLNIAAVDSALNMGAKVVWLPTVNSAQGISAPGWEWFDAPPIPVLDEDGEIRPEVHEIFDLVRSHDAVLATGHITADEHYAVVKEFGRRGKVVVTHAGEALAGPNLSTAQCVELADLGGLIEFVALGCGEHGAIGGVGKSPETLGGMIDAIEARRCILSSDLGWVDEPPVRPVPGLRNFLEMLWKDGEVPERDLEIMCSINPAALLNLAL